MADNQGDYIESKKQEIYWTLYSWYEGEWGCEELIEEEIIEEFEELYERVCKVVRESECACADCNYDVILDCVELLESREKHTSRELDLKADSLSIVFNCLGHLSKLNEVCSCCAVKHSLPHLVDASTWLGVLQGSLGERNDFGTRDAMEKANNARHAPNRKLSQEIKSWYLENSTLYKSKKDAANAATQLFNMSFSAIRKHLIGL
jgi:hypothetical protein